MGVSRGNVPDFIKDDEVYLIASYAVFFLDECLCALFASRP